MKKITGIFLAGLFLSGLLLAALVSPSIAAGPYDRYERGYPPGPPPPPRGVPPPPPRHALHSQPYFFGHVGIFEPNDDDPTPTGGGLGAYDSGGSFDIGFGSRVSPILAVDGTFGAYGTDVGPNEVTVIPLTVGLRLIIPNPVIEPYIGGGVGLYFADLKEPVNAIDDSDTTVGAYASIGVDMWLSPRIALNLEGKYHWAEPTFADAAGNEFDIEVGGWTASLGIRVGF
jgi:opacity protein-like surface antigen